ncbi:MAG: hypothetical protein ACRDQF_02835 [Thermocrispum sp.]
MSKTKRPYWQDTPCPSWCIGGHRKSDDVADRRHLSKWETRSKLALYSAKLRHYPASDTVDGVARRDVLPGELIVAVTQMYREVAPRVNVGPEFTPRGRERPGPDRGRGAVARPRRCWRPWTPTPSPPSVST